MKDQVKIWDEGHPDEWILVVPANVTPPERTFVTGLAKGNNVKIRIPQRTDQLANHRDNTIVVPASPVSALTTSLVHPSPTFCVAPAARRLLSIAGLANTS